MMGVRLAAMLMLTLTGAMRVPNAAPVRHLKRHREPGDRDHSSHSNGGQVVLSTTAANVGQPADSSAALGSGSTELPPEASMVPEPGPEDQQQQEGGAKKQPSYVRWHVIKVPFPAVPQLVTVAAAETGSAWCFRHACAKVANVSPSFHL